ncbi:MAG: DUF1566 domain-containing protein [bacterium]
MPPDSTQTLHLISDPAKLIEIIVGSFAIIAGLYAAAKIILPWWRTWRDRQRLRTRLGAELYTPEDILRATTYYIRPNCQQIDPAGGEESRLLAPVQEDLFQAVDRILASPNDYKYAILLADSGMGKTSFVLNYYAYHWRYWRKRARFDLAIVPLGIKDADKHIQALLEAKSTDKQTQKNVDPKNTVLFLDALDEDARAIHNHRERLGQLLELSRAFRQVLISCRTQFFLKDEEIPRETGVIRLGVTSAGQAREYMFYKLYLSPFSEAQVDDYLQQRFPIWRQQRRRRAREIVKKISDLIARPMLLAHIQELVDSGKSIQYAFQLYEEVVEAWLKREQPFVPKETLRRFSELLAVDLYLKREARESERVPETELEPLAVQFGIKLEGWQLRGRSLLNRDAVGNFKFAHRSIMEYLFVKRFVGNNKTILRTMWTDQMKRFALEMLQFDWETQRKVSFDLSCADLSGIGRLQFKPLFKLRSSNRRLELEEVQHMLKRFDFFDTKFNNKGLGLIHLYERRGIEGNKVVIDHATGLMWQQAGSPDLLTYADAGQYIRNLNEDRFAGNKDWRLPTLEEAMSLMALKKQNDLYIDPFFDRRQHWIWTADKASAEAAWVVFFGDGLCFYRRVLYDYYVRAVRVGQSSI